MTKYIALVAIVFSMAVPALAGDGAISGAQLNALGLSGMQPMSDAQAMQVRGKGYEVVAYGQSTATVWTHSATATSTNGYLADKSGSYGTHVAFGANISVAHAGYSTAVAGGASIAVVH